VELFEEKQTGSGQMELADVAKEFGWPKDQPVADRILLSKLMALHSYDVYSLRISLREHGIAVNNIDALKLSPAKNAELTEYMTLFTRPLILQIYGGADVRDQGFRRRDSAVSRPRREEGAREAGTDGREAGDQISEVPQFSGGLRGHFLSLSYYRQCLDHWSDHHAVSGFARGGFARTGSFART